MDWQTVGALAIVAIAVGVLLRHGLRVARGSASAGCGSCPARTTASPIKSLPLVQISSGTQRDTHSQRDSN